MVFLRWSIVLPNLLASTISFPITLVYEFLLVCLKTIGVLLYASWKSLSWSCERRVSLEWMGLAGVYLSIILCITSFYLPNVCIFVCAVNFYTSSYCLSLDLSLKGVLFLITKSRLLRFSDTYSVEYSELVTKLLQLKSYMSFLPA